MRMTILCAALILSTGCAIKENVMPVSFAPTAARSICIIEHPATRDSFLDAYQRALRDRGFEPRVLPEGSALTSCPITSTYLARWSWDFTIYMAYAELHVYHDGREAGHAVYDSRLGGLRLDKWVDADVKIRELVDELYVEQR